MVVLLANDGDLLRLSHESREPPLVVIDSSTTLFSLPLYTTQRLEYQNGQNPTQRRRQQSGGVRGSSIWARLQRYSATYSGNEYMPCITC